MAEQSVRQKTSEHPGSPAVPLACCLWLADYREKNSLGVLSHTSAEAEGLATTKPHCQNVLVLHQFYLPWNFCYTMADFCHVFRSYMTPGFLSYSLLSQHNFYMLLFYNSSFFAYPISFSFFSFNFYFLLFSKLVPSLSFFSRSYISSFSLSLLTYSNIAIISTPYSAPFSAQFRQHIYFSPL